MSTWSKSLLSAVLLAALVTAFRSRSLTIIWLFLKKYLKDEQIEGEENVVVGEIPSSGGIICNSCKCKGFPLTKPRITNLEEEEISHGMLIHYALENAVRASHMWKSVKDHLLASNNENSEAVDLLKRALNQCQLVTHMVNRVLLYTPESLSFRPIDFSTTSHFDNSFKTLITCNSVDQSISCQNSIFYSAVEESLCTIISEWESTAIAYDPSTVDIYEEALFLAEIDKIPCNKLRTTELKCGSNKEYLAKLHCIRESTQILLNDSGKKAWLSDASKSIIGSVLRRCGEDSTKFEVAFDQLMNYSADHAGLLSIRSKLDMEKLPMTTFYDVVDYVIFDVLKEMQNPSVGIWFLCKIPFIDQRTRISSSVTSKLNAERKKLKPEDELMHRLYDVLDCVAPTLAWCLLGTDKKMRPLITGFLDQITTLHADMFNAKFVRFVGLAEMTEDIWNIYKNGIGSIMDKLTSKED